MNVCTVKKNWSPNCHYILPHYVAEPTIVFNVLPAEFLISNVTADVKLLDVILVNEAPEPENTVAPSVPLEELNVRFEPLFGSRSPLAAVANRGKQVVSVDSSATVTAVAIAAVPDVFWLPLVLTPGRLIFAVPSNETQPIFLAVSSAVAVAALPDASPVNAPINPVAVILPVLGL